jgi:membrane-bound lytic murein transglycosylase B
MHRRSFALLSVLIILMFGMGARAQQDGFERWVIGFKNKAKAEGISTQAVDDAFTSLEEDETVIRLDRKQPENKITLEKYLSNTISTRRVEKGRQALRDHAELLSKISAQYGVQPKYIVALWAIESDFGEQQGNFSVVRSLATLAYEGRRAEFFGKELIAALKIIDSENIAASELSGSWAGAMGGCQFMPSTYRAYAVDGDGDGKRDIWSSQADVFASIANYLHSLGWNPSQGTMEPEVIEIGNFKSSEASLEHAKTADYWGERGIVTASGFGNDHAIRLAGPRKLYAIYLSKVDEDTNNPVLVGENFKALLNWNRSRYFATAVGTLADAIGE